MYDGRNFLLTAANVKETLSPQYATISVPIFTMSISGYGKMNLSAGKLGPIAVTIRVISLRSDVKHRTGGVLNGIVSLKFFR